MILNFRSKVYGLTNMEHIRHTRQELGLLALLRCLLLRRLCSQVSGFGFRFSVFGFSGFWFGVSGSGFGVSGFGFRV